MTMTMTMGKYSRWFVARWIAGVSAATRGMPEAVPRTVCIAIEEGTQAPAPSPHGTVCGIPTGSYGDRCCIGNGDDHSMMRNTALDQADRGECLRGSVFISIAVFERRPIATIEIPICPKDSGRHKKSPTESRDEGGNGRG